MRVIRTLVLSLATLTAHGGAVATVHEPADEAGAALTTLSSAAAVSRSGETDAPLRALNTLRSVAAGRVPADRVGVDKSPEMLVVPQPVRTPGSWALLVAGLAGIWAIGRRRLSSTSDRSIARYRKWRE